MPVKYNYLRIALSTTLLNKINKSAKDNKREKEKEIVHILNDYFKISKELRKYKTWYASLERQYDDLKRHCSVLEGKKKVKREDGAEIRLLNISMLESVAADMEKLAISRGTTLGTEISLSCQSYISEERAFKKETMQVIQYMDEQAEKKRQLAIMEELIKKVESLEKEVEGLKG